MFHEVFFAFAIFMHILRHMFRDQLGSLHGHIIQLRQTLREITSEERSTLERNGNIVSGNILVSGNANWTNIRNNVFLGTVILNKFEETGLGLGGASHLPKLSSCIGGSTLSDVVVDGACFVKDCAMIHSVFLSAGCVLISNGIVAGNFSSKVFGIGTEIVLCEETGSRSIFSHPDKCSLEDVSRAIQTKTSRTAFNEAALAFKSDLSSSLGNMPGCIVGADAVIMKCSRIESSWIQSGCRISNSEVSESIVHGGAKIDNGIVEKSILGRLSSVESFSVVEHSILCDFTKVSIHGKVVHSLVGSYSGVESGECVSSLLGPFVGFHHQSLCIATYWPSGRGNIGYGANVGSNHSGKAPDCELIAGEGVFFGLATVVKFPCNFANAPYSLIASGVTCLPQKLEMPFSLINSAADNGGLNEIWPAWVLSDNMFTLLRNEDKFGKRQRSEASVVYEHEIFRPDIMDLVIEARKKLMNVSAPHADKIYTESDIPGLGKNILRESARLRAIDTYSFVLRWYALRGYYRRVTAGLSVIDSTADLLRNADLGNISITRTNDPERLWAHCRSILLMEQMNLRETKSLLEEFSKLDFLISANCVASKTKDDVRGSRIVGNLYSEFHQPAAEHPVCVKAKKASAEIEANVAKLVSRL